MKTHTEATSENGTALYYTREYQAFSSKNIPIFRNKSIWYSKSLEYQIQMYYF